ncbi:chemotaxis protein histidine kinase CheA/CheY-like chemotaxis protein [Pseudomonas frederiksbergensis]|uniref:hybrid sensor histidine kinase/response regulator n=1 Tax=Pseudomonas TaxID=286 RepID=UPI003D1D6E6D
MSKSLRTAHLSWLRSPIQKGVDVSKSALDVYHQKLKELASPPGDAQQPWFEKQKNLKAEAFNTLIREVGLIHSSLAVVGCVGAAALAFEIKVILNNISLEQLEAVKIEPALLSVLSGLLMIPNYIKMIIDGAPDSAGILSKPINELREIRNVPVLEEDNLLPPDIEFVFIDPPLKDRDCAQSTRNEVFSRAPKKFREAFSTYIGNHSKPALAVMKETLRELQEVTNDPEVGCFWWIGECLTEALGSGAIRSAGNTLSQLRMLSVAIQRAESDGEEGAKQTLGVNRFKSLLSVLSMSTKLSTEIADTLAVFNVRKTVDFGSLAQLQSRIESSQAATLADIAGELKPLLETAMVSLGRARSSKNQDIFETQFESYRTAMRHVTSVFYMVNENELAGVATKALSRVEQIHNPAGFDDSGMLEHLLTDILFLDERINGVESNEAIRALNITGVKPDVISIVVSEGLAALANTRKLITQHVDGGTGPDDLKEGLQSLQQASAALAFVGAEQVSILMNGACQAFINMLNQGSIQHSPSLALAARAMVAIEIYLTSIKENLEPSPDLLTKSEQSLSDLGIKIAHVETVNTNELIKKFEDQAGHLIDEENPFLSEINEIRATLEKSHSSPEIRKRAAMDALFKSADKLSIAAKMYGFENFSRIARALATYADKVTGLSAMEGFDFAGAQEQIKQGIEVCLQCMDEYSARGRVSLFTKDLETALLASADPSIAQTTVDTTVLESTEAGPLLPEAAIVLEGELDSETRDRPIPDDFDAGLIEIFREEFKIYQAVLLEFTDSSNRVVTRDVCRAAHTIHGISGSADCALLHEIYGIIESRLEVFLDKAEPMDELDVLNLSLLLLDLGDFEKDFPWVVESPLYENWKEIATAIGAGYEHAVFEDIESATTSVLAEEEIEHDNTVINIQSPIPEKIQHAKSFEAVSVETDEGSSNPQEVPAQTIAALPVREYSDEMATFYIEEADDVLPELQENVTAWLGNMNDPELVATIKRQMHTLKGAALMAEAEAIATITHSMESLFESISLAIIKPDSKCAYLVRLVLNAIQDMTSVMRQRIAYETPISLINCLQHAVDSNEIDLTYLQEPTSSNAILGSQEMSVEAERGAAEEPSAEPNISHAKTSDADLVEPSAGIEEHPAIAVQKGAAVQQPEYSATAAEFYIDEADDVLPELQANVSAWLGNMNDPELVATIKRQMHTLKGAALMAEADSIGAMTHSMESLFESISLNLIEPDQKCAELVRIVLNTILEMTSVMRQGIAYESPTALIACLKHAEDSNEIDLSYLSSSITPVSSQPQHSSELAVEVLDVTAPNDDVGEGSPQAIATTGHAAENPTTGRKRARGGRGKGGAKRLPAGMEQAEAADVENGSVSGDTSSSVNTLIPAVHETEPASPEKISHAEFFPESRVVSELPAPVSIVVDAQTKEATESFERRFSIESLDEARVYQKVQSRSVLDMLQRCIEPVVTKKQTLMPTEKMKVDLKLLENAGESASELTAVRHRVDALNEDQILGMTVIREMLEVHSLQHGQFTTALRGHFNQQPTSRNNSAGGDDGYLERFTNLSAMHVALGAQIDEILGAVAEVYGFALQKRNALRDQGLLISGLQRDLLDSRLVPFINIRPNLNRAIQQACTETKKEVSANYIGGDVIMDKMIQDKISEPLTHILRNAIDHGIETKAERVAAGKPATGTIDITVHRRAKHVVITVKDDGRGIDVSAVRKKAIEKKIITEHDDLTDKQVMHLITSSGFSTKTVVTNVSGRGVGMNIVAAAVDNLGGQLIIDSVQGKGTTFTVELPFTIGSNRAMMCSSGSQWFAIPSYFMTQVIMTDTAEINRERAKFGKATVEHDNAHYEVVNLADLIAMPDLRSPSDRETHSTLILCEQGDIRFAIEVEKVESMPEIHIRKLEGILSQARGIVGETEKQDGTPVFVLDVMELARLNLKSGPNGYQVRQNRVRSVKREQKPIALVIDDARQYRTLLERYLTDMGYIVVTARDGEDAMQQLPLERMPELIIVDIEMPRMNGFEFTKEIRSRKEYKDVPIIMVTTRTGLEEKAYQAGVNVYVNKPCNFEKIEQAVLKVKPQTVRKEVTV